MHHGVKLNNYNTRLNEARLSAIAICLYLASLKLRNKNAEIKLLHLDDVFIGLDSANRRPILNIIDKEFPDYQIIISTYDKSWFSLAKEMLNDSNCWKYIEFYEGEIEIGGHKVVKPIIIEGSSYLDKAKMYLFDQDTPDYPASANYMRKAFEELLSKKMYPTAVKDVNLENMPSYKIPMIINNCKIFLNSLQHETNAPVIIGLLDKLATYLKPMLHPLSHYAPGEPVYKNELISALNIYEQLSEALQVANYTSKLKPLLTRGSDFKFEIKGKNWTQRYTLIADYDMFSYKDGTGNLRVSLCPIRALKIEEEDIRTGNIQIFSISKNSQLASEFKYVSLEDCVTKITAYLNSPKENKTDFIVLPQITDMFFLPKVHKKTDKEITYTDILTRKM